MNPDETALASAALTREVTVACSSRSGAGDLALCSTPHDHAAREGTAARGAFDLPGQLQDPHRPAVGGELGELLTGFNAMASQLEAYDEANIEELTAAQVKQQS